LKPKRDVTWRAAPVQASWTGMGLSISESIVEAHGRRISAMANSPHGDVRVYRRNTQQAISLICPPD
jgi:signal transduction histidine kinase